MSGDVVVREATAGNDLWEQARLLVDARPLDYILTHADLYEPQAGRSRVFCATQGERLLAVGTIFRPQEASMLTLAGEDPNALQSLAAALAADATGRVVVLCRERDTPLVRQATGLGPGEREVHMTLDGLPRDADASRARRVTTEMWGSVADFYQLRPGQVFFSEAFRSNPSYCIEADGKIVAAAICHFVTPRVLQIGAVLTDPDYRRRGYAASIVAALATEAHETGRIASLFVRFDNEGAIALYEELGFVRYQMMSFIIGGG
jgi:ribosomal protein S18 acetylase RimI-like enzyme